VLLARMAEDLYWASRYLERVENTARIVREHTNLIVDIPTRTPLTWEPLLALTGTRAAFDQRYRRPDERSIMRYLLTDPDHPGSVTASVSAARQDLRTTRQLLPLAVWEGVNDLHLYVKGHGDDGVERRSRIRFLDRVTRECFVIRGVVKGSLSRDEAYLVMQLGSRIERADMTTRIVDTRAVALLQPGLDAFADVQWAGVLRSLSAQQMYHRTMRRAVDGPTVVRFLLTDPDFPRSVAHCLGSIAEGVRRLPRSAEIEPVVDQAIESLHQVPRNGSLDAEALRHRLDQIQVGIAAINDRIGDVYFSPTRAATRCKEREKARH
jgi:uncharacterized alpha-E superfamily protein